MILKSSINQINNKVYNIPEVIDDKSGIDEFLQKNKGKKVVVVQGLGFVGAVMSLIVANALTEEYAVIGIDLASEQSYWKICAINEGVFPIISSDNKIKEFFDKSQKKENLYATYDPYAYTKADVVIVDINLDVQKETDEFDNSLKGYEVNLNAFKSGIHAIAKSCKSDVLVLVETTVPPGTCLNIVKPIFDEELNKRGLDLNYKLGHSYERVMPGPNYIDSIQNFYRVYSGIDDKSALATEEFLRTIISTDNYPLTRLNSTTATEMAKVMENSFRAMNIAFIQEWTEFAEDSKVNLQEVIKAIKMRPTHNNMMFPGLGVGGYCLTKDPLLASWSSKNIFNIQGLPQSETAVRINDLMPNHSFRKLSSLFDQNLKGKQILLLGLSYLSNVGDTRYSPVEVLYNRLQAEEAVLFIHDPYITFWEEKKVQVETDLLKLMDKDYDAIVFCTGHSIYSNNKDLDNWLAGLDNKVIYDSNLILSESQIKLYSKNNKLKIVGRGDL
ncbi:nucleotide sugar dehydrogenase [Pedobacter sp. KBW06]|uniref:nucleotide sugar dehydrogenase n=1 Tax=Pedobacter sp. KBW06 TaxID=2153359 RepID=UPI000F5B7ACE|nr:nucleotide sugar dehydrogenase [Pedobacter sp. KBW06]RQO67585.1 nucleotide sugar dehydrogenase [Pedobacter sp. KBW06]